MGIVTAYFTEKEKDKKKPNDTLIDHKICSEMCVLPGRKFQVTLYV